MLVGSHAETGDEFKAAAAPLPHVIGNVQTAARFGALGRATCAAAQDAATGGSRSRARAGRFGMLWLTALAFALGKQEALATFEKGLGSTGSSTPPALEQLPVQP